MICLKFKNIRSGWVLYVAVAMLLIGFLLVAGIESFRSGSTRLLSKNIEQEEMICLAQCGIDEIVADIKSRINKKNDGGIGQAVYNFYKNETSISKFFYDKSELKIANEIVTNKFGNSAKLTGDAQINIVESLGENQTKSHLGFVDITAKLEIGKKKVEISEKRDIKIVNLSDPFLDSYALFVKSYIDTINEPDKTFVVEGIFDENEKKNKSYIYLGNRNHPNCDDCKNIVLDLDFENQKKLLGDFHNENGFDSNMVKGGKEAFFWTGNFFMNDPNGEKIADKFSLQEYEKEEVIKATLDDYWNRANIVGDDENSVGYIARELGEQGFKQIVVDHFKPHWRVFYGYTDYMHLKPMLDEKTQPFLGIAYYFDEKIKNSNCMKVYGGRMPDFFGPDPSNPIPIFIEGPAYLRFFKLAFIDSSEGTPITIRDLSFTLQCNGVELRYTKDVNTVPGKKVGGCIGFSNCLGSHPIDDDENFPRIPINALFFGKDTVDEKPHDVVKANDIFPVLEDTRLISHYYNNANNFYRACFKTEGGKKFIALDGINIIAESINLAVEDTLFYRGKGYLIVTSGDCAIGNLKPWNDDNENNYLKIYLCKGGFYVPTQLSEVHINASLIATTNLDNNDSISQQNEGTFYLRPNLKANLLGNLIVDALPTLKNTYLTLKHSKKLLEHDYPVRVSVGSSRKYYNLDYSGGD